MSSPDSTPNENTTPPPQTVNLDSLTPVQCLNVLWSMLNNASSKGAFTIDESYVLKIIFQKITAVISPESLNPVQTPVLENESKDVDV